MAMKITYKDVGQGDSIILEWNKEGTKKVAVIDCNKKGKLNPVLQHIITQKYYEIDLLVLSHPHRDHYSGFLQLLEYIEKNKIIVKKLAHTLHLAGGFVYWKYFEVGNTDSKLLAKIVSKWSTLKEQGLIKKIILLSQEMPLKLEDDINLICLAPSNDDALIFQNHVKYQPEKNIKESSQAANHLSTIFSLCINENYLLFTADAEISALNRAKKNFKDLLSNKFQVCQIPHHGSEKNYDIEFWESLPKFDIKFAVASAGEGLKYNHPSVKVLNEFKTLGYEIHCTNILNGMKEHIKDLELYLDASINLEGGSFLAEEYQTSGDRSFTLTENGFVFEKI